MTAIALTLAYKRYWPWLFLFLGLLWASLFALASMAERLPEAYQNKEISIQGYVLSLPQLQADHLSFDFAVTQPAENFPKKIRLSWYDPKQKILAGQSWQLNVKLKQPHSHLNPGGFDYQTWLYANHFGATGYVRDTIRPQLITNSPGLNQSFAAIRQTISERLDAALPAAEQLGLIKALTLGIQTAISPSQWEVFRTTGTTHLIVISGSHISLIAGLVYLCIRRAWAWLGLLSLSPQQLAAWTAWLAALFYAGLAGYSIPTLRAVIMLTVVLAAIIWQRHTASLQVLLLAMLAVLIFDPLAVLAIGFWLSFLAVALLIYVTSWRLGRQNYWQEATITQLATSVGLSPLLIVIFQQVSLVSPLANWLAVPIIGIFIVPIALLAIPLLFIYPALASLLLEICNSILQGLWWLLVEMAKLPIASIYCPPPPWHALLAATIAVPLLLAPKGFPGRYLSLILFLPLIFVSREKPPNGTTWLTVLDVGQGLSSVIQTAEHTLVYDTGGKFSEHSDMAETVLIPFLHRLGIAHIDKLVISHADIDHSGGAATLLAEMPVAQMLSSATQWAETSNGQYCQAGQNWQWDQVSFTLLSPPNPGFAKENDNSCVLKIDAGESSFLLTADIEHNAESWLVQQYGEQLHSSVLIAPHHGSKTSSSLHFLQQVRPELIVIPAGHLNRFGFPHRQVIHRYQQLNLNWLNTAEQGAITIHTSPDGLEVESERAKRSRYWMVSAQAKY